jgi:hypothetical protein
MLFRSTSTAVTKAYRNAARPHGSSISSDTFASGVVRSGTDFTVYTDFGMDGMDLAFYQRRSLYAATVSQSIYTDDGSSYHTKDDSVPSLGGKAPLWAMLEASLASVKALANTDKEVTGGGNVVYFDLLGRVMVVAKQSTFFVINLVLLIAGPLIVLALLLIYERRGELTRITAGWMRLPAALFISFIATLGTATFITSINPVVRARPHF